MSRSLYCFDVPEPPDTVETRSEEVVVPVVNEGPVTSECTQQRSASNISCAPSGLGVPMLIGSIC
jgi:hypothetical protein